MVLSSLYFGCLASPQLTGELTAVHSVCLRHHHESGEGAGSTNRGTEAGGGSHISSDREDDPEQDHLPGSHPAHWISISAGAFTSCGKILFEGFFSQFRMNIFRPDCTMSELSCTHCVCWLRFLLFSVEFSCASSASSRLRVCMSNQFWINVSFLAPKLVSDLFPSRF